MTVQDRKLGRFLLSTSAPCPYLPGRRERKIFTLLPDGADDRIHDALTLSGFRRSQNFIYRPACGGCASCLSVRIRVADFHWSKSLTRLRKRNRDLRASVEPAKATEERFALFQAYVQARHGDGDMASMSFDDFRTMVETSPVETRLVDHRDADGRLLASCLYDRIADGPSLVYSFFDPSARRRSLGVHMILDQVARAAETGLAYVYLGYWVAGSEKMAYKRGFEPLEAFFAGDWRDLPSPRAQSRTETTP